jgi:putative alpha-1,2-mannosidase
MQARNATGVWASPDDGWTEGDKWAYTFDVVHDVDGLIERRGGKNAFVDFLDEHFDGGKWSRVPFQTAHVELFIIGHNDQTNEVRSAAL